VGGTSILRLSITETKYPRGARTLICTKIHLADKPIFGSTNVGLLRMHIPCNLGCPNWKCLQTAPVSRINCLVGLGRLQTC
jgi:hypothetical protein